MLVARSSHFIVVSILLVLVIKFSPGRKKEGGIR
jgi:hypothetical protein